MTQLDSVPVEWLYGRSDLLDRLGESMRTSGRSLSLLLGSAVTAPPNPDSDGIPDIATMIGMVRSRLTPRQLAELDGMSSDSPYQAAFRFLTGRYGQGAANEIIRTAVARARKNGASGAGYLLTSETPDAACRAMEDDVSGWHLPPAVEAIGGLAALFPNTFGRQILTTNFDPLVEVAIRRKGGTCYRTVLHADGNVGQTEGNGTHVIHLHGGWYGSDTLHSPVQLTLPRPRLKASLAGLLRSQTLCVSGYGGWDDVFTAALLDVVHDDSASPDIVWCFYDSEPRVPSALMGLLATGMQRGRITIYSGVDCHSFWPQLLDEWQSSLPRAVETPRPDLDESERVSAAAPTHAAVRGAFERGGQDRPPLVEHFVGRHKEMHELTNDSNNIAFVTGIGGEGKSALAAAYFAEAERSHQFEHCIWRDCKEESEHFERQLATIIAGLTGPAVSAFELARRPINELTELLLTLSKDHAILVTFDNIDFYIDLESGALAGGVGLFVEAAKKHKSLSRFIFTCRPPISAEPESGIFSLRLSGLSLSDTQELFSKRKALAPPESIARAQEHTNGHALWLDLLAAQVARDHSVRLEDLLHDRSSSAGTAIPRETLDSIWATLKDRERMVLRTLAESVRPATEVELEGYLGGTLRFNQMAKATRYLRDLGLIVVKPQMDGELYLELHPLIRTYIRQTFKQEDRSGFIVAIINFYNGIIGIVQNNGGTSAATERVQRLSEIAELRLESGDYKAAFNELARAHDNLNASEHPEAYIRTAGRLMSAIDWQSHSEFEKFDSVIDEYADLLSQLGRFDEARKLMSRFRETIKAKTARYVRYCKIMCNLEWLAGDYNSAIAWGEEGENLKQNSGADIPSDIEHYLALARRDKGNVDSALEYFLHGSTITDVLDPEILDEDRGGPFYGNIGRCLQKMGQMDTALVCYRKSATIIERAPTGQHVANQAYVRQWIGEVLLDKGEFCTAKNFLEAAVDRWSLVSPPKASKVIDLLNQVADSLSDCTPLAKGQLERYCRSWIYAQDSRPLVRA